MATSNNNFFQAIKDGDLKNIKEAVQVGLDLHKTTYRGQSLMLLAIESGQRAVIELLLELGVSPTELIKSGYDELTPLHMACKEGQKDIVELLLQHTELSNCKGEHYDGLHIHVAAKCGHVGIVSQLVSSGIDIDIKGGVNEETPLHAAARNGQLETVAFLLQNNAKCDVKNRRENTPLHFAASSGHLEVAKLLLDKNASPSSTNDYGATPLHLVTGLRTNEFAQLLINNGGHIEAKDAAGTTPLINAAMKGDYKLVEKLIELGANVNATKENGASALTVACNNGKAEIAQILILHGAKATTADLLKAIRQKSKKLVQLLLQTNISLAEQNKDGLQPLHLAVALGYVKIAQELIDKNAPINGHTASGLTPRDIARQHLQLHLDQILADRGATTTTKLPQPKSKIIPPEFDLEKYKKELVLPQELLPFKDKLLATVKPYLHLIPQADTPLYPWESKFGGTPYLPKNTAYPKSPDGKHLYFLAQINFQETPPLSGFPTKGLLSFYITEDYISCPNKEHERQDCFRVLWFDEIMEEPTQLTLDFDFLPRQEMGPLDKCYGLHFQLDYAPISWEDARFATTFGKSLYQLWEASIEDKEKLFKTRQHKVGGYGAFVQDDPRYYLDPNMAEYYESNRPEDYQEDDKAPGGRRYIGPKHETLLLQIASYDGTDICWGDCGTAAFFICPKALSQKDFSRVFFDWACA